MGEAHSDTDVGDTGRFNTVENLHIMHLAGRHLRGFKHMPVSSWYFYAYLLFLQLLHNSKNECAFLRKINLPPPFLWHLV